MTRRIRAALAALSLSGSYPALCGDAVTIYSTGAPLQLALGSAFDIVGSRRQADFRIDSNRNTMTEEIEVKLRNSKDENVAVIVKENLYRWTNWKITQANHPWEKQDACTIHFPVDVPARGQTTVHHTVRYIW